MEHFQILISVAIYMGLILGSLLGFYYLKTRLETPKHIRNKLNDANEVIKGLKTEVRQWKGKFNARNVGPAIEKSLDGESVEALIPELAQSYVKSAPNWLKPILSNPDVIKYAVGLAKDNPEKAKEFIEKFISKKQSTDATQTELSGL